MDNSTYPLNIFTEFDETTDPRQIMDALEDAGNEMSYSNYHNRMFRLARRLILLHCRAHKIKVGPNRKTRERRLTERTHQRMREFEEAQGDSSKILELIRKW